MFEKRLIGGDQLKIFPPISCEVKSSNAAQTHEKLFLCPRVERSANFLQGADPTENFQLMHSYTLTELK
jgi:hypothetical protein